MRARRTLITVAAALALVAGGTAAGAAIASGPVGSDGTIYGCYGNTNADGTTHNFVLQNAGTPCPSNMTAIQWSQTGPAGAVGPSGPSGPPGPTVTVTVTASPSPSASPSPTSTLFPSPNNNGNTAVNLGTLNCGQSMSTTGVNVGSSNAWYEVTMVGTCSLHIGSSGSGDVFDVLTSLSSPPLVTGVTSDTEAADGTYFIHVYEGPSGVDGQFTITVGVS